MSIRYVAAFAVLLLFSGCAIHPLPEDVAGVDTYQIVRQIRCETREAIRQDVVKWLAGLGSEHNGRPGDPIARRLALQYENYPESISGFSASLFPGSDHVEVRSIINLFFTAGIAYNFDLSGSETNDLAPKIDLLQPLTNAKFTLGVTGDAMLTRTNDRIFTVTDTFGFLLTKLNVLVRGERYCDGQIVRANYVYPVAGRIGVDRLVDDFINLTLFGNLAGAMANPGAGGAPTMADHLSFTTAVMASANPMVVFTPVTRAFQFADANLMGTLKRTDLHQVTVALAIAKSGMTNLVPLESYLFSSRRGAPALGARASATARSGAGTLVVGARVMGGGTPSEVLAVLAIDQIKSREVQILPTPGSTSILQTTGSTSIIQTP